jgi:hypothetical protein
MKSRSVAPLLGLAFPNQEIAEFKRRAFEILLVGCTASGSDPFSRELHRCRVPSDSTPPSNKLSTITVSRPHEVASRQGVDVAGDCGRHDMKRSFFFVRVNLDKDVSAHCRTHSAPQQHYLYAGLSVKCVALQAGHRTNYR